jgi:hypothetical protein
MQKKRINIAEKYPRYFAAAKRTEDYAELTDDQEANLASLETHIESLETENVALKEKAPEVPTPEANTEETPEPVVANVAVSEESSKISALEAKLDSMMALLDKKPAADGTVITTDARSEGGGKAPKKMMSSVEQELNRLHGVK